MVSWKGFGRFLFRLGVEEGPLNGGIGFVAPLIALRPPPITLSGPFAAVDDSVPTVLFARPTTPPVTLEALLVTPPTVLLTPPTAFLAPPTAPYTWLPPGYFFAPKSNPLVGAFVLAGVEFERFIAGLRAVEGSALPEGL